MDIVIKVAAIGAVGAIAMLVIKKDSPAIGLVLGMVSAGVILIFALDIVSDVLSITQQVAQDTGISSVLLSPLFKTAGIGIITRISADVCKDAGQASSASAIEMAGTSATVVLALPLVKTVLELINSLI